ncbi:MAG TPA: SGNH/GDSL hydrolase family protein [Vicinamibacteria bacterium]
MIRRAFVPHLVLASLGVALALVVGEALARLVPPLARRAAALRAAGAPRDEVHPRGLYRVLGESHWTLAPGFSGRFVRPAFDVEVRANSLGLRDREPGARAPGVFRVLGLGDSFAFGWGVPAEACFLERLGERLDASRPGVAHEVLNAGIPGYGTWEARAMLRSVAPSWAPDLVILAFYEGNDYLNNGESPRRRAVVDGYLVDLSGRPGLLARHSALAALVADQWRSAGEKRAFRASVGKTKGLLAEMKASLGGVPLVVVFIPDQDEAAYRRPPLLRLTDRLLRGEDVFRQRGELASFCQDEGIGFCRLSSRFEDDPGAAALRLSADDTHFNAEGHRLAAEEIHAWLEAHPRVLEGRRPPSP